ncbi:MAG: hypothetical protein QM762_08285 [Chryseolinea sp.]
MAAGPGSCSSTPSGDVDLPDAVGMPASAPYDAAAGDLARDAGAAQERTSCAWYLPLEDWLLETTGNVEDRLILTLATTNGFSVAFSVSHNDLAGMFVSAEMRFSEPTTSESPPTRRLN